MGRRRFDSGGATVVWCFETGFRRLAHRRVGSVSNRCGEELCPYWGDNGCVCAVMGMPLIEWCRHQVDKDECDFCEVECDD